MKKKYVGITSELSLIVESTPSDYIRDHIVGEITDIEVIV